MVSSCCVDPPLLARDSALSARDFGGMDRVPFVGARVPAPWTRALPLLKAVDAPLFQKLLKCELINERERRGGSNEGEGRQERERA